MNTESLITFVPFLAVLYVVFALIQALRKKQQGICAIILALIALVVPIAALVLNTDSAIRSALINNLTLNAVIVFVGSILILMIEGRNPARTGSHSYGMLGIGLGVLIAVCSLAVPALIGTTNTAQTAGVNGVNPDTTGFQNVSQTTTGGTGSQTAITSAFAEALSTQTGLTSEELTTQLNSGSKITDLVSAHGGDLNAVITAAATGLDDLKTKGGMATQMLSNLGDDTTVVATQYVNGELEARARGFLTNLLLTGGMPNPPVGVSGTPGAGFNAAGAPGSLSGQNTNQVASAPTAEPTQSVATPTEVTIRPTLISFPSPTPTPVVTQVIAEADATQVSATCTVTPIYNLNLRDEPNTDGKIYLSIPYGTQIVADGHTADDWYNVTYNGQAGWVSGEYLSKVAACGDLAVVEASS